MEYSPPLDLAKPFVVTGEVPNAQIGQFDEATATITLRPDGMFQRLPDLLRGVEPEEDDSSASHTSADPPGGRKGPMLLPEPHIRQLQYRIHLPAGFKPKSLPASSVKRYGPATIRQKYEMAGDDLIVATFGLDTGEGRLTAEEVDDLRQGIAELAKDDNTPWEVNPLLENAAAAVHGGGPRGRGPGAGPQRNGPLCRSSRPACALLAAALEGGLGRCGAGGGPAGGGACADLGCGLFQPGPHVDLRPVGPPFPAWHGLDGSGSGLYQGIGT